MYVRNGNTINDPHLPKIMQYRFWNLENAYFRREKFKTLYSNKGILIKTKQIAGPKSLRGLGSVPAVS